MSNSTPPTEPSHSDNRPVTLTCQITGGSVPFYPGLHVDQQPTSIQDRFGYRPGAEDGEAGVWEVGK